MRRIRWSVTLAAILALAVAGCGERGSKNTSNASTGGGGEVPVGSNETYYWISQDSTLPLFVNNDLVALKQAAKQLGVKAQVEGPTGINLSQFISTITEVCARHPNGVIVVGWDPSEAAAVNQCIKEGVPTVTDDADLPSSNRLAFVGTDWYDIGVAQAKAMIQATGGKGEIATTSIINADNMRRARQGFMATIAHTGLKVVADEDDGGDRSKAAAKVHDLLAAYPNLAGIVGFDAESGPGISQALKEAGKTGKVKVTTMEADPSYFKNIQTGAVNAIIVQKRELFTYYALKLLVDYNHNGLKVNGLGKEFVSPIPVDVNTGLLTVDKSNVGPTIAALDKANK